MNYLFHRFGPPEGYTVPNEIAGEIDEEIGSFLQNPGRDALGVIDDDTYFENLEYHHQRLADVAEHVDKKRMNGMFSWWKPTRQITRAISS